MRALARQFMVVASLAPLLLAGASGPEATVLSAPRIRAILTSGEIASARLKVGSLLEANASDARLWALLGDISFRQARFSEAKQAYVRALEADRQNARGHLGLGRLELIASHRAAARDHIAKAFQLDPHDQDIILSYADFVEDKRSRIVLLRNFLVLAGTSNTETARMEEVAARLQITERLRLDSARLASPYQSYRMKLAAYLPDGRNQSGLLIQVSLNAGKPLRLILDSGADGIFISSTAARSANVERLTADRVSGAGFMSRTNDYVLLARNVRIGDLELEDSLVHVTETNLFPEADGVIGTNVFEKFLVRVAPGALVLDLAAFPDPAAESIPMDSTHAYRVGHLLLVHDATKGYFMIDTGASYTVTCAPAIAGPELDVRGAQGKVHGALKATPLRLNIEGRKLTDEKPIKLDLSELSGHEGVEISGIIGYPVLGRSVLTINYRDGLVQFGQPSR